MRDAHLKYLTEVLGIESVLRPIHLGLQTAVAANASAGRVDQAAVGAADLEAAQETDFLDLAFCIDGAAGAEEKELLKRIIAALKLERVGHQTYFAPYDLERISAGARAVVVFGDQIENATQNGLGWLLKTHSLQSLARDASLKKSTWTGLQELVAKAGL